jgi:hypothetical protein
MKNRVTPVFLLVISGESNTVLIKWTMRFLYQFVFKQIIRMQIAQASLCVEPCLFEYIGV